MKFSESLFETKKSKTEEDVIDFYNDYAKTWDQRFHNTYATNLFLCQRYQSFVQLLNAETSNWKALELGVGTGIYLDRCSTQFREIIALDGSHEMLQIAKKKIFDHNIRNVTFVHKSISELGCSFREEFDIVYFFGVLEHILDVKNFVKEINLVLKKGGIVVGVTPNGLSPWYKLRRFIRGTGKHCSSDNYYNEKEIKLLFNSFGFGDESFNYWGAVPAGIKTGTQLLEKSEKIISRTFLRFFLGGLTFKFTKLFSHGIRFSQECCDSW